MGAVRSFFREFLGRYGSEVDQGVDPTVGDAAAEWEERQQRYPGAWWDDPGMPPMPRHDASGWLDETASSESFSFEAAGVEEQSVEMAEVARYEMWNVSPIESLVVDRELSRASSDDARATSREGSIHQDPQEPRASSREGTAHEVSRPEEDEAAPPSEELAPFRRSEAPSPPSGEQGSVAEASRERSDLGEAASPRSSERGSQGEPRSSLSDLPSERGGSVSWSASRTWSESSAGGVEEGTPFGTRRSSWHGSVSHGRLEDVGDGDSVAQLRRIEGESQQEPSENAWPRLPEDSSSERSLEAGGIEHPGSRGVLDEEAGPERPSGEVGRAEPVEPSASNGSDAEVVAREAQDNLVRAALEEHLPRFAVPDEAAGAFARWVARNWRDIRTDERWFERFDALWARRSVTRRLLDEFNAVAGPRGRSVEEVVVGPYRLPRLSLELLDVAGPDERALSLAERAGLEPGAFFDPGHVHWEGEDAIGMIGRQGHLQEEEWVRTGLGPRPETPPRVADELDAALLGGRRRNEAWRLQRVDGARETASPEQIDDAPHVVDARLSASSGTDVGGSPDEAREAFVEQNLREVMEYAPFLSRDEAVEYLERLASRLTEAPDWWGRLPWTEAVDRATSAAAIERDQAPWLSRITEETVTSRSATGGGHDSDSPREAATGSAGRGTRQHLSPTFGEVAGMMLEDLPPQVRLLMHRAPEIDHGVFEHGVFHHQGSLEPRSEAGDVVRMASRRESGGERDAGLRSSVESAAHADHGEPPRRVEDDGRGRERRTDDEASLRRVADGSRGREGNADAHDGERARSQGPGESTVRGSSPSPHVEPARSESDYGRSGGVDPSGHEIDRGGPGRLGPEQVDPGGAPDSSGEERAGLMGSSALSSAGEHAEPVGSELGDLARPSTPLGADTIGPAPSPESTEGSPDPATLSGAQGDAPASPDVLSTNPSLVEPGPLEAFGSVPTSPLHERSGRAEELEGPEGTRTERFPAGQSDSREDGGELASRRSAQDDLLRDALRTSLPLYGVPDETALAFSEWAARNWREAQGEVVLPPALDEVRPGGDEAMAAGLPDEIEDYLEW